MTELDEYFEKRKREIERDEKIARFGMAIFYSFVALSFYSNVRNDDIACSDHDRITLTHPCGEQSPHIWTEWHSRFDSGTVPNKLERM